MKGTNRVCRIWRIALAALILLGTAAAAPCSQPRQISIAEWNRLAADKLVAFRSEIEAELGAREAYRDDLLGVDIAIYPLTANDERAASGRVYYADDGKALGFSLSYPDRGLDIRRRFLLTHLENLLHAGEFSAIAGTKTNCRRYEIVSVGQHGADVYTLDASLYGQMAATGDVPSLPPDHGRLGLAA